MLLSRFMRRTSKSKNTVRIWIITLATSSRATAPKCTTVSTSITAMTNNSRISGSPPTHLRACMGVKRYVSVRRRRKGAGAQRSGPGPGCERPTRLSGSFPAVRDQGDPQVVDVGARRPGHEQRPSRLQGRVGVVGGERLLGVHTTLADLCRRGARRDPTGSVGRAVVAVGVRRKGSPALDAIELDGEGQDELLVRAPDPSPAHGDGSLTAGDHGAGRRGGVEIGR